MIKRTARGAYWVAKTNSLTVELDLKGKVGHFKTKEMTVHHEKQSLHAEIIMPNAQVSGVIKAPGRGRFNIRGMGMINHARSTTLPPKIAKHWFKLYAFPATEEAGDLPAFMLIDMRYPVGLAKAISWVWHGDESKPRSLGANNSLHGLKLNKRRLKLGDHFKIGHLKPLQVRVTKITPIYSYEPVKAYGVMGRLLKSWVGDPINRTSFVELNTQRGMMRAIIEEVEFR